MDAAGADAARAAADDEPFSALAFKIMNDPFVGSLTYFRVYSGKVEAGATVYNATQGQARAHRAPAAHARQQARGRQGGHLRQHRRGGRPARHHHGRHALRREGAGRAGADGLPRAGHLDRDRAEDPGQPGQAGPWRWPKLAVEDPSFSVQDRSRDRADASSRGWASCTWRSSSTAWCASSRSRPTWAARRSRTARRSRAQAEARGQVHPPDGRARPVRPRRAARRAGRGQAASSSRTRPWAAPSRASSCRRSSAACASRWRAA